MILLHFNLYHSDAANLQTKLERFESPKTPILYRPSKAKGPYTLYPAMFDRSGVPLAATPARMERQFRLRFPGSKACLGFIVLGRNWSYRLRTCLSSFGRRSGV